MFTKRDKPRQAQIHLYGKEIKFLMCDSVFFAFVSSFLKTIKASTSMSPIFITSFGERIPYPSRTRALGV